MLSPRGQAGLEAKTFVLGLGLEHLSSARPQTFLLWPRENECNDGTVYHCEFAMIIYQSYLLTYLVLLI